MINLSKVEISESELIAVSNSLQSGWLVQGENVKLFEKSISEYINAKNVIAVSSGTAALHLAILALGIGENDEVILPSFTFPATANVVSLSNAIPVLVDIDLKTFNIDVAKIEEKITKRTRAIMPVHQFGLAANIDEIKQIARKHSLFVVEDAACALGSKHNGGFCGNIGDLGCFSFHPRKVITTGEGGAIATNNDELAEKIRLLRNHGIFRVNEKIDFTEIGFNYRMTDFQGALGKIQMTRLKDFIDNRRRIARFYKENLKDFEFVTLPNSEEESTHIYQTYHILLNEKINRDLLISKLKEKKIETNYGASNLSVLTSLKKYAKNEVFRNSQIAFQQGLALPIFPSLTENEIIFVCENLKSTILEII